MHNALVLLLFFLCYGAESASPLKGEPIAPLPQTTPVSPAQARLGARLFHDPLLSRNNTISCAQCHHLDRGGMDGLQVSIGISGAKGEINSPSIFNSGFNFRQFWDGRAASLEDQIDFPLQNKKEMGSTWAQVLGKLAADPSYPNEFRRAYPDGLTKENVKKAIADFERTLITPNSRFDQYLRGDENSLSAREKTGYQRFKSYGCVACHQGMNIGGNMYQTMGVMGDYFRDRGTPITEADLGRYNVTKKESDRHIFRVPSLRNVALTAPYFHDGSAKTLEQAVNAMAKYQLGRTLSREDIAVIVAFLKTLTGTQPTAELGLEKK